MQQSVWHAVSQTDLNAGLQPLTLKLEHYLYPHFLFMHTFCTHLHVLPFSWLCVFIAKGLAMCRLGGVITA